MPQTRLNLFQSDHEGSISGFVSDEELQLASGVLQVQIDNAVTNASNIGAGVGVFDTKTGTVLDFKTLVGGSGINFVATATEVTANFTIDTSVLDILDNIYYPRNEHLVPSLDGVSPSDFVFHIGDPLAGRYTAIFAASGVLAGPLGEGKLTLANADSILECSVQAEGFPTALSQLHLLGARAVVMSTWESSTPTSGIYMGPTQRILMGDIEGYSKDVSLLYTKELQNYRKKITSILNNTGGVGTADDNVCHYILHKSTLTGATVVGRQTGLEVMSHAHVSTGSPKANLIGAKITALNTDIGEQNPTGTYAALDCRVQQSGGGTLRTAKAAYFGGLAQGLGGRITDLYVVHIGAPSGGHGISRSLWCEGDAQFGDDVEILGDLDVSLNIVAQGNIEGEAFQVNDTLTVEATSQFNDDVTVGAAFFVDNANASISGVLETELRRDASRTETLGLFDTLAFDRNLIYVDFSAAAAIISISDPGQHGQLTKVIAAQNAGGTLSFSWSYTGGIRWRGGIGPTFSPTPNGYDILSFLYDAVDDVLYGDFAQGFV